MRLAACFLLIAAVSGPLYYWEMGGPVRLFLIVCCVMFIMVVKKFHDGVAWARRMVIIACPIAWLQLVQFHSLSPPQQVYLLAETLGFAVLFVWLLRPEVRHFFGRRIRRAP